MDEEQARALLARMSGAEVPPSRVSVELARISGRRRLRRRRAALSGTPAVAVAVVALLASGILPGSAHSPHRSGHPAAGPGPVPSRTFNPLVPYAAFGWLPAGNRLIAGTTGRVSQFLAAGPKGSAHWTLTAISQGRCNLTAGQVLQRLQQGGHPELNCVTGPDERDLLTVKAQVPSVNGRLAFRTGYGLVWEYARGSWAELGGPGKRPDVALMVKVASGVTFGHLQQPALEFPVQLTGVPAGWRIGSVHFTPAGGILIGQYIDLTGTTRDVIPQANVTGELAGPGGSCYFYPHGQSQRRTINGIKVVVNRLPAVRGNPVTYQVCAAHARGLFVFVDSYGQERPRAVSIFTSHLRILGADPANWTTKPLG